MRRVLIPVAMAALLAPEPSGAQVIAGARVGAAFAMGDVGDTLAMSDWTKGQIPVQLDLLYRVSPRLAVGGYFSWGFGLTGDAFEGLDYSARITRLGVEATYSFTGRRVVPWIGAGFGYEWNTVEDGSLEGTFTGFEFLNLQGGGDFEVTRRLSAGPYVMLSLGQYDEAELGDLTGPILHKKLHEWLSVGLRATFDL
jgi:hypothetical protein